MQKYRNQLIAGLGIALAIYVFILVVADNSGQFDAGVVENLRRFPAWLLIPLILTQVSAGFFRFLEWQYFLGVIDARDKISVQDSAIIFTASLSFVVSPGKLAELLKSVLLKMKTGVLVATSAPIVIAERVVDGMSVIATLTITLLIAGNALQLGSYRGISEGIVFSSAIVLATGLIVIQIAPLAYFCLNAVGKLPLVGRLQEPLTIFYESSREIFKLKHVIPTTGLGLGVYMSSTTGFVLVMWGFGLQVTPTLFVQAAFIVGVASAIGALSFVPNGAGVTEISNAAMLTAIVAPSNPEMTLGVAAATALIQGFFHKWFRVFVGMGVAVIYRKRLFTTELESEIRDFETNRRATSTGQHPVVSMD